MVDENVDVSVIIPVHNASDFLDECLQSVLLQDFAGNIEISIFDDSSTDDSNAIIRKWSSRFEDAGMFVKLTNSSFNVAKGVGYAKNRAIAESKGTYLCFLDADDVMHPNRIRKQQEACKDQTNVIVGCQFHRLPKDSTPRYTAWANNLLKEQLYTQAYTAFGPTLVMPTWFCHRNVYTNVGNFDESGKGTPEDLLFFYAHLKLGGKLCRVEEDLLMYRYHPAATTFSVLEETVWDIRMKEFEKNVLAHWTKFTIWNAGKQGRKFYRSLSSENKQKVEAFCDVDVKKLFKGVYIYEESQEVPKPRIPIVHFLRANRPFILCVKLQMTKGQFEDNLHSLGLTEGTDYYHFS